MESEITFLDTYQCPRCQADLSAGAETWSAWLRCPRCGRASRPPDTTWVWSRPRPRPRPESLSGVFIIGPGDTLPVTSAPRANPRIAAVSASIRRLVLSTALILSILMLLFSLMDQNNLGASIFGFSSLLFLGLLLIPSKR